MPETSAHSGIPCAFARAALSLAAVVFGATVGNAALLVACVVSRREHR